ncbi:MULTISPECIES: LysR family transcriptional regulator [unclassified Roseitalea]|uniref:LysR family transcriptional regulator n=1 Tax=unclassified Roseitalea TaxID=2639107 RepID=UPI00273DB010|nr:MULTISPECIES: LysR family transcriptional regulator [unclassified Roseitalea]
MSRKRHTEQNITVERLEFQDLKVLLAVAEIGSFRQSALHLNLGQSAVSRRVQKLENALGVSLFERRPTGARLTRAGSSFAARARSVFNDLHHAVDTAHAAGMGGDGTLNVGMIASLSRGALRDVVAEYAANHPGVNIGFVESERGELLTLLSHRQLDVVIASGEFPEVHGDSALLIEEPIYIALHDEGLLAERSRLAWDEVREAHFLVSATEPGPEIHDYLIRRLARLGRRLHVTRHRLGREGIMNLVGLGLGVSLVADHWRGVRYPNVKFVPIGDEDERVPFSLAWRPDNDNPALRRFVSLARVHAKRNASPSAASQRPDPSP